MGCKQHKWRVNSVNWICYECGERQFNHHMTPPEGCTHDWVISDIFDDSKGEDEKFYKAIGDVDLYVTFKCRKCGSIKEN